MTTTLNRRQRAGIAIGSAVALTATTVALAPTASGAPVPESKGLRKAVTLAGIREHQTALQNAARVAYGKNTRASGTEGYANSVAYVTRRLRAAGYTPQVQDFEFPFFAPIAPAQLSQVTPSAKAYETDYYTFSGSGTVEAPVVPTTDVQIPPPATPGSTSGCERTDFPSTTSGAIALIQRGTCTFAVKAENAIAAGAVGVVIFNEGQPGRTALSIGTLGGPLSENIPVVGASFADGKELYDLRGQAPTARIVADTIAETRITQNILAETPMGDPTKVVQVGSHLDSVAAGTGINDNGSGSATILEVAEQLAARDITPRNKVRFSWWGAEELGLLGSEHYVDTLPQAELDKIALNLNFDMVGSPNYVRFVYDGDNSAFPVGPGAAEGPEGSGEIERVFHEYFGSQSLASAETPFSGRSDYGPFIAKGIPAGGLFTGAEGLKTEEQAQIFGGTAGQAYDPCYHQACDTVANNSDKGLDEMSDAVAHAVLYFAKRNLAKSPLVNPAGPVSGVTGTESGGGLHDDES